MIKPRLMRTVPRRTLWSLLHLEQAYVDAGFGRALACEV